MLQLKTFYSLVLILSLAAFAYGQGGNTRGNNTEYTKQLNQIIKRHKVLLNNGDSLNYFVRQLNALNERFNDQASLVYIAVYKSDYELLKADYVNTMQHAINALNLAHRYNINRPLPHIYSIIGNLHKENTNYTMAFEAADNALWAAKTNKDTAEIISALGLKAMFKRGYVKHFGLNIATDTSINLQFEGLKLAESSPKYQRIRIRFYDNIAQHYIDVADYKNGILYAQKGVALATKLDEKRSLTYGYSWLGVAQYYSGSKTEGINNVKKALDLSISLKQPYRTMELYELISNCYQSSSNYKDAFFNIKKWQRLRDSINVQNNEKQISELQIKYESVKKSKDLAVSQINSHNKTRLLQWLLMGIILFLILVIVLIYLYRIINNKNNALQADKLQINEQADKLQTLMRELHHRVKNNLQIVSSLLSLQSNRMADGDARYALDVSRQRIEAMSIIHNSLYQHDSANKVNMNDFLTQLLSNIQESFGVGPDTMSIVIEVNLQDLDVDLAMPLGLILNEWVTNVFKHAYKAVDQHNALHIYIGQTAGVINLEITDNGIGMPLQTWENPRDSFGIKLMKILIKQIGGISQISNNKGTTFKLTVPYAAKPDM